MVRDQTALALHRRALDRHLEQASWRHERAINGLRILIWSAVGISILFAGRSEGRSDLMGPAFILYAGLCTVFGFTVLRRTYRPWFPVAATITDITVLMGSAFGLSLKMSEDPSTAADVINGAGMGLMVILASNALRMDGRTILATGVYGISVYVGVRWVVLEPSFFWLVDVVMVGSEVILLTLAAVRNRQIAEQLFGEVRELYDDRVRVMGRLVAGAAHELNNPVGTLQSSLHTLQRAHDALASDPGKADRVTRAMESASSSAQTSIGRITQTLDALKAFARPDEASVQDFDLGPGILGTVELLRAEAAATLSIQTHVDPLPKVRGNPAQLNQVLFNLLKNADQAMAGQGSIRVRATVEQGDVVIRVEDDGPGIPKEVIERVFEPGFRPSRERVKMGLGLAVSRSVVQDHGGTLQLASEPGRGTVAAITLPVVCGLRTRGGA